MALAHKAFALISSLSVAFLTHSLQAQTEPAAARPKVGVALAGGSALGFAHVGVIRWLEEHRIPVDGVAGTSMGGLVGGMFATGANSAEMTELLEKTDWATTLQPSTPFRQLAYRRKEDRREYPNQLQFGIKQGKLRLPSGISAGHGIGLVLSRIAGQYGNMTSFDDLPTPFRCVAVDLAESKEVVFDHGDLYDGLRATMSLPAIFPPVEQDGKILVDGGVLNNLPVDVARKMGSQIVIAVALHAVVPKKTDGFTLLNVAGRSIDIMINASELRSMANADVVVIPDLNGLSSGSFERATELIRRGYDAAAQKANVLTRFAVSEEEWRAWAEARQKRRRQAKFEPTFVRATGLTKPLEANLEARMEPVLTPPVDRGRVEQELTRITGLGRWESASYSTIEEDGKQGLLVKVKEKGHGPPFVNTAILIDGGTSQVLRFGVGGRVTFLDVLNAGSEWRTDFLVGNRDILSTEYFHRVRSRKLFVAPRAFLDTSTRDLYDRNERFSRFRTRELGAALDLGYAAGRFSEFRFGYQLSRFHNNVSIGLPSLPSVDGNVSRLRARYAHEGQDNPVVATRGIRAVLNGQFVFSAPGKQTNFPILDAELRWARPMGPNYVWTGQFAGGTTISSHNLYSPFTLGGPLRLTALGPQQYFGDHYYFGDLGLLRAIARVPLKIYGGLFYETGAAFSKGGRAKPYNDGALGLIGETPIGVVYVGGAFGEQGQRKLFIRIGRYF